MYRRMLLVAFLLISGGFFVNSPALAALTNAQKQQIVDDAEALCIAEAVDYNAQACTDWYNGLSTEARAYADSYMAGNEDYIFTEAGVGDRCNGSYYSTYRDYAHIYQCVHTINLKVSIVGTIRWEWKITFRWCTSVQRVYTSCNSSFATIRGRWAYSSVASSRSYGPNYSWTELYRQARFSATYLGLSTTHCYPTMTIRGYKQYAPPSGPPAPPQDEIMAWQKNCP